MSDDEWKKNQDPTSAIFKQGGCALGSRFHDMAPEHQKTRNWSTSAPAWRQAVPGVNLEGNCTNNSCAAHAKGRVIIQWGRRHFDFFENEHQCACPLCEKYVQPIICGFTDTEWRATGIRKKGPGAAAEKIKFPWKTAPPGSYSTFDDDPKNYAQWKDLRIEVRSIK